jgi:protein-histidine pros-kinase
MEGCRSLNDRPSAKGIAKTADGILDRLSDRDVRPQMLRYEERSLKIDRRVGGRQSKLVLSLGAAAAVGLLALLAVVLEHQQSKSRHDVATSFSERTRISAALTNSVFEASISSSQAQTARRFGSAHVPLAMLERVAKQGKLQYLVLMDAKGTVLSSTPGTPAAALAELRQGPALVRGVLAGQPYAISDVLRSPRGGPATLWFAQTFPTKHGQRVLVSGLAPDLLYAFLGGTLKQVPNVKGGDAYVLDSRGAVIASPNPNLIPGQPANEATLLKALERTRQGSFEGGRYFASSPVPRTTWRVVLTAPEDRLFASVNGANQLIPWLIFIALGLAVSGALLLLGRVLRNASELASIHQRAESKFRQLLELAPDAIIGIGADGRIELTNSQAQKLFGYSREELVGERMEVLIPERYRDVPSGTRFGYLTDPKAAPMGAGIELHARRKDGSEFPCEISLSSIQTDDGVIDVAAIRDVTQRKRAEAEAEGLKSEFFALVSHELRTPLTSILGYVDVLSEQDRDHLSEAGQDFLCVIKRNSLRLDRLVQDLLMVTQVEAGSFAIDVSEVDVAELASNLEAEIGPTALSAGVSLSFSVDPMPPFQGDPTRLTQVLDNFISNAIKFTPEGGQVEVAIRDEEGSCVIEVADTGVGIEKDEVDRLFDRFYRSRSAGENQVRGVGLGLAIAKAIVESHGGTVEVESEPGHGSTFRARLPIKPAVASPPMRRREVVAAGH